MSEPEETGVRDAFRRCAVYWVWLYRFRRQRQQEPTPEQKRLVIARIDKPRRRWKA